LDILENRAMWAEEFRAGFLAHFDATGQCDFKQYKRIHNHEAPSGPGVNLTTARLAFIPSAGAYLRDDQEPFDAPHPLGDYSVRLFPMSTPLDRLAFAHTHYNHAAVDADPQVLVPLRHLEDLVAEGRLGSLAPQVISFMGYLPDVTRIVDETLPRVLAAVRAQGANAALLAPA
jgi:D-proline reductase (dithiol) PrdB